MNPLVLTSRLDVPLVPDAPGARDLLQRELSKPEYQTAQPSLWDIISKAFWDWVNSLRVPGDGPFTGLFPIIAMTVVVVGIVIAFIVWGVPRINRRSTRQLDLFGERDDRTADQLRRDARTAAGAGDWTVALQELYRAIARGVSERTIVVVSPGTTAHGFAARAAAAFPAEGRPLERAADVFDAVRYLDATGTEEQYRELEALDARLATAAPAFLAEPEDVRR
ncbi:DUF4129 domain-containing protein [Plantibacter sp. VKM Ac-2880]|uniref:DUF4129 domain-containing protein n=1 Tax=Plantibacter sp. VKM Ac-2880 TaxID=2783827 RepID=UPI00188DE5B3|nr:DUF4129 domain-containing protein [Plantibacter sp. VKM Ac-2880]MBF4569788.1 DUF4129 domain-containing protein [Plantibacter sp. VKM Ac-2880]